jgi:hypothetical protein
MYFGVGCMLLSLLLCPLVSFFLHWENVLQTHCKVPNVLPSISSVIGNNTPGEDFFWF